jgi:DNA-binding CsgD family transcriptional regulator/HEPN domain-containing protein
LVAQARGAAASTSGSGGSRDWLGRAVALLDEGVAEPRSAEHLYWAGRANFMLGRNHAAAAYARRAMDAARDGRSSMLGAEALRLSAMADFDRGRWRAAYAAAAQAVELATELGLPAIACACLGLLAEVDAGTGNAPACTEHATRAVELAVENHLGFSRERAERALGQLALATGNLDDAVAQFERVWARLRAAGNLEPNVTPLFDLIEAYVRLGRVTDATDALAWAGDAYPPESPVEQAWFDRSAGLLEDNFETSFERALAAHEVEGFAGEFPFDVARINLAFGERLRRDGRRREARAHLETAQAMFEEIGASAWVDRAATELDASGARRRPAEEAREHLTPRELQIAVAVAEGRSNREVAAELFLTPKTVEYHLTRVYRKLGVRSRTELVRQLSRESAG